MFVNIGISGPTQFISQMSSNLHVAAATVAIAAGAYYLLVHRHRQRKPDYFGKTRTDAKLYDVRTEAHPPTLYSATAVPCDYNVCAGSWDAAGHTQLKRYEQQSYLVVNEALTVTDVHAAIEALGDLASSKEFREAANRTMEKQSSGTLRLSDGGDHPVLQLESFAASIDETERFKLANVHKLQGLLRWHPTVQRIANDTRLRTLVSQLLVASGASPDDAAAADVFQSLALLKPRGGREKPWHQDLAYFNMDHTSSHIVGCWIALSDVTAANGAMHVLPTPIADLECLPHFTRRDWQICDTFADSRPCVAVPLSPGGALLFSGMLPHGTPTNLSGGQRLALQFHFIARNATKIDDAERQRRWGGDGRGVHC